MHGSEDGVNGKASDSVVTDWYSRTMVFVAFTIRQGLARVLFRHHLNTVFCSALSHTGDGEEHSPAVMHSVLRDEE